MYEEHAEFTTPPDLSQLWRYLDVGRFLGLLNTKALYFARIAQLDDPWEAAHSASLRNYITTHHLDKDGIPQLVSGYEFFARSAAVNCWHENEGESIAMWSLYNSGSEGVAIQTTVGQLKAALKNEPRSVLIGRVRYIDYERDPMSNSLNALSPLMHKRRSYQHEAEVRAIIPFTQRIGPTELVKISETETRIPDPSPEGLAVSFDPSELIMKIVVSPRFPQWAIPGLQSVVDQSGLKLTIEKSDLLREPPVY